ncbi:site-2 protease family protein [Actinomadura madurae]|uniref:site-2 protease family protein n=1 Tax=Actinomadura madurae TaxID=1993 RepID=UPI0020D23B35|nr:site-2 protease family protein [Actinomadura madurae]MCP9947831.1 site-2 protease family protein [Actinomadura madurae]
MTHSAPPTQGRTPAGAPGPDGDGPERPGLRMGRILGVPVYVSPSWFLVAALVTIMFEGQVHDVVTRPASYLVAFTYAALLYGSVFVHELSHAVTARAFGLPVRSVTLHILGGETAIEREAPTPGREFLIAFAGPLTNLLLAGAGLLAHATLTLPDVALLLLEALTFANLLVGLFNLLPGLPLDGGRLVRAAVWKATGNSRNGAVFAGWVGRAVAIACLIAGAYLATYTTADDGGIGWLALLWSALVASFIWVGATQAIRAERVRDRIPLLSARHLARRATLVTSDTPPRRSHPPRPRRPRRRHRHRRPRRQTPRPRQREGRHRHPRTPPPLDHRRRTLPRHRRRPHPPRNPHRRRTHRRPPPRTRHRIPPHRTRRPRLRSPRHHRRRPRLHRHLNQPAPTRGTAEPAPTRH